jgi:hypothetical protein
MVPELGHSVAQNGMTQLTKKIAKSSEQTLEVQDEFAFATDDLGTAPKQPKGIEPRPACFADKIPVWLRAQPKPVRPRSKRKAQSPPLFNS